MFSPDWGETYCLVLVFIFIVENGNGFFMKAAPAAVTVPIIELVPSYKFFTYKHLEINILSVTKSEAGKISKLKVFSWEPALLQAWVLMVWSQTQLSMDCLANSCFVW